MSRSGYSEGECDDEDAFLAWGRQQGQRCSAQRGKRGQRFFRALVEALDAMPERALAHGVIESDEDGCSCAMGVLARSLGVDLLAMEINGKSLRERTERRASASGEPTDVCQRETLDEWAETWTAVAASQFDVIQLLVMDAVEQNDEDEKMSPHERWEYVRAWAFSRVLPANRVGLGGEAR